MRITRVYKNHDDLTFTTIMWAKLSNALKSRPTVEEIEPSSPDVMSSVLEKHPNLSLFHDDDDTDNRPTEVSFLPPSPPSSPSRSRHGMLRRRMSRSGKHDNGEPSKVSSALKLPLRLPKKVKSHMSIHTNSKRTPHEAIGAAHRAITSFSSFRQHHRFSENDTNRCREVFDRHCGAPRDSHGWQI
jgi:hypothetical protein